MEMHKYDYLIFPEWKSKGVRSNTRSQGVERRREREREGAMTTRSLRGWKGMIGEARSTIQTAARAQHNLTRLAQLFEREREGGARGVCPSSEHCCSLLNDIGVTTKYCSL